MKSIITLLLIISGYFMQSLSQDINSKFSSYGEIIQLKLANAAFPHPQRANGHTYKDKVYPADIHYSDSTVAYFIPKDFKQTDAVNIVIHFHGWGGNIEAVFNHYDLVDQFCRSGKNAILIIPQGAKDTPDSFGGKLEDKDGFKKFINESLEKLFELKKIKSKNPGKIILAGHSGGYRVMSYILMHGGMNEYIKEAYLFDALYGQTEKFTYWVDHYKGKLINIYTTDGETMPETKRMIECLEGWGIPYISKLEKDITSDDIKNNKNIFIYSDLTHNQVIYKKGEFYEYIKASCLDDIK